MAQDKRNLLLVDDLHVSTVAMQVNTVLTENGDTLSQPTRRVVGMEAMVGTPEGVAAGTTGDIRIQVDTAAIWQKQTGTRTKTGWVQIGAGAGGVTYGTAVAIPTNATTAGTSANVARADHTHALTTVAPAAGQVLQWDGASWVPATITSGGTPGGAATPIVPGAASAAGVSTDFAREDHEHALPVATAVAISGNASAAGASTSLARADHTHQLTSGAAPAAGQVPQWDGANWVAATVAGGGASPGGAATTLVPAAASSAGVSANYSREDHAHAVPVASATSITDNTSVEGTSTSLARADHRHRLTGGDDPLVGEVPQWNGSEWRPAAVSGGGTPGGAATTLVPAAASAAGASTNYSREDHEHAVPVATAVTLSGNANSTGTSASLSRADHTHQLTSTAPAAGQVPQWDGTNWVAATVAGGGTPGGAATALVPAAASAAGVSTNYSREDHAHAVPVASAVSLSGNANAEGVSASLARADHTHQLTTAAPSNGQVIQWDGTAWTPVTFTVPSAGAAPTSLVPAATSAAGVSTNFAREDHAHAVPVAAAVAISGNANAEGVSASLARADHTHQLTTAAPSGGQVPQWDGTNWVAATIAVPAAGGAASSLAAGATSASGVAADYSREDHAHAVPVATAVAISGNASAEGASASLARADHTHQITSGVAPTAGQVPQWDGTNWVAATVSAGATPGGAPTSLTPGVGSSAGASTSYSREDHVHAVPVASATAISGNVNSGGGSASLARADHLHQLTSGVGPTAGQVPQWDGANWVAATIAGLTPGGAATSLVPGAASAAGASTNYSREDHSHAVPVATAVAISGNASAEGASASLARADHTHQITSGVAPTAGQVAQWDGTNWVAATIAGGTPASAVTISDNTNAQGVATTYALSDHTHQLTATAPTTGQRARWDGTNWVPDGVVEQGIIIPGFDNTTPTGTDDPNGGTRTLLFTGASIQIGAPALASWVTRDDSATLGTRVTILQPGIYNFTFFSILSGANNANVKVNLARDAPAGILDGSVIPGMQQPNIFADALFLNSNRVQSLEMTATNVPITRAMILAGANVMRVMAIQTPVGTPTVQILADQFIDPPSNAALRITRVGEVVG